ncbi:hypothetical protein ACFWF7_39105 [Nocardia sp. NPDC060256]|uniref:hypothetical protein n=1 Tax=unclassified Nocardia TaxID=2637762 RepID=UPI00364E557F
MNSDQISMQTAELASRFGVLAPHVESGDVPDWCADGVQPRFRTRQPVLIIGPAFDKLSPAEQQGALAAAMLSLDLQWTGRYKPLIATMLLVMPPLLTLIFLVSGAIGPVSAPWHWALVALMAFIVVRFVVHLVLARRIIYVLDRRMTEAFGQGLVHAIFDLDDRSRAQARGAVGILIKLGVPSKIQRTNRLGTDLLKNRAAS